MVDYPIVATVTVRTITVIVFVEIISGTVSET